MWQWLITTQVCGLPYKIALRTFAYFFLRPCWTLSLLDTWIYFRAIQRYPHCILYAPWKFVWIACSVGHILIQPPCKTIVHKCFGYKFGVVLGLTGMAMIAIAVIEFFFDESVPKTSIGSKCHPFLRRIYFVRKTATNALQESSNSQNALVLRDQHYLLQRLGHPETKTDYERLTRTKQENTGDRGWTWTRITDPLYLKQSYEAMYLLDFALAIVPYHHTRVHLLPKPIWDLVLEYLFAFAYFDKMDHRVSRDPYVLFQTTLTLCDQVEESFRAILHPLFPSSW